MTHFTVLVKYEGNIADYNRIIGEMLAPFDENKKVPRYKERLKKSDVEAAQKYFWKKGIGIGMSPSGVVISEFTSEQMKEYFGNEGGKDKQGYFLWKTYNPASKWDWYMVGGRWQGLLKLKEGAKGISGTRPLMSGLNGNMRPESKGIDVAYLKDVDFDGMRADQIASETEEYYKAVEFTLAALERGRKFDQLVGELYFEYGIQDESLEELLARRSVFATHAVVDDKGWHEASEMGWFGTRHDETEDRATWAAKFAERWLSNPTDKTVIAVVDAHI